MKKKTIKFVKNSAKGTSPSDLGIPKRYGMELKHSEITEEAISKIKPIICILPFIIPNSNCLFLNHSLSRGNPSFSLRLDSMYWHRAISEAKLIRHDTSIRDIGTHAQGVRHLHQRRLQDHRSQHLVRRRHFLQNS